MTCSMNTELASYALGSLSSVDHARVQHHLADCQACRDELADIAGVLGLLRRIKTDQVGTPPADRPGDPAPPADTRPMARSRRTSLVAGLAVLLLVTAIVVAARPMLGGGQPAQLSSARTWTATDPISKISADAQLARQPWGTSIRLQLQNLPPRLTCRLVVRAVDGSQQTIGTWRSGYAHSVSVPASTAYGSRTIAALDVVADQGRRLISLSPPRSANPSPNEMNREPQ
jgi:anti-sigma factor RsiW